MADYFSFASAVLFCVSMYTLARANGWALTASLIFAAASVGVPFAVIMFVFVTPALVSVAELLVGIVSLAPFVMLLALCKSVANRVSLDRSA